MAIEYIYPPFEVIRRDERCTRCRICEKQCANGVHTYDAERKIMLADESKCVNCQRCVALCPTRAIKIVKTDCCLRENENWKSDTIREVYKQAATGGILLSSTGNPTSLPGYWDRLLINASQVIVQHHADVLLGVQKLRGGDVHAQRGGGAAVRPQRAHENADEGGFARAVLAHQTAPANTI